MTDLTRSATLADSLLLGVAVVWGSTYFVAKDLLHAGSVLGMLSLRMGMAALALGAALLLTGKRLSTQALTVGAALGLLLSGVFALETFGIAGTSATNAGVIISLTMVFTPFAESAAMRCPLKAGTVVLGFVAVIGVALLSTGGGLGSPKPGDWLILGAASMRTVHVTVMKRMTRHLQEDDSLSLTFAQLLTCGIIFTLLATGTGASPTTFVGAMSMSNWLQMGFLTVVCTVFPFWVQMWTVHRTSASHVALLLGTEPVFAALFGITLAGDRMGPLAVAGVLVVLSAVGWNQVRSIRTTQMLSISPGSDASFAVNRGS